MRLRHLLGPVSEALAPSLVTLCFVLFFVGLCWFVYRRERNAIYAHLERMPLEENDHD